MAIIVEEEKKSVNWLSIAIAAIVIVVIFAGAYFIFFKQPQLIPVVTPTKLQEINKISKLSFDPQSVVDSPIFKSLREYGNPVSVASTTGRDNPFAPAQ